MPIDREAILSPGAPAPVGPYSHAVRGAGLVFTAGLIPTDPMTGALIEGDVQAQTRRVLDTMQLVLEEAGTGLEAVVKMTVYLADLADFEAMNAAYQDYFPKAPPARTTYQPGGLPLGALVEMEAVALSGS
ncbi:Rid family detoxifying hydrolase [Pseudooceanicola sp. C21-150M6]|uniref:Rid family detoxifying hydrolase n=1 Tax=Pseudooceanicola sp. C21-150M6 TaxID=3434355 RepID=UPI003D7FD3BF